MAEREGFEPPVPVRAHSISSAAPSATRSPLLEKSQLVIPIRAEENNPKVEKPSENVGIGKTAGVFRVGNKPLN